QAHRIADAPGVDLAVLAVAIHPDDAADPPFLESVELLRRRHVEGLPECNVELVVRPDAASPGRVIVALVFLGNKLALRHDRRNSLVRTFVEELGRREHQYPVLLDHEQKAVLGEAHTVGDDEIETRSERLDLTRGTGM